MEVRGTREWIERWGWGFSDSPERAAQEALYARMAQEAEARQSAASAGLGEAYRLALHGTPPEEPSEGEPVYAAPDDDRLGCWGPAYRATASPVDAVWGPGEFAAIMQALDGQGRLQHADPRMIALDSEWSHCMADAGFPDIPHQSLVQSVWLDKAYPVEGAALQPGASHARMEIVMTLADFDCRQAIGFDDREREIRVEVENRILAENQESVDALLALVQTVRPGS